MTTLYRISLGGYVKELIEKVQATRVNDISYWILNTKGKEVCIRKIAQFDKVYNTEQEARDAYNEFYLNEINVMETNIKTYKDRIKIMNNFKLKEDE